VVVVTRADEATDAEVDTFRSAFADLEMLRISILDPDSLDALRDAIWRLTGLIRIYLRTNGSTDAEPLALPREAAVADVAESVHSELASTFSGARIWGPSARFDGQRVGREHIVQDTDTVEIV